MNAVNAVNMFFKLKEKLRNERMEKCEEKENPYDDYSAHYDEPWVFHERLTKCRLWKKGSTNYEVTHVQHPKRKQDSWYEFGVAEMDSMVSEFFTPSGKPRLHRLGQHVDKWLVWVVTQGYYRMDSKKRIFTYKGVDPTILHFKASKGMWDRIDGQADFGFPILKTVTETCNRLYAVVLRKLSKYRGPRDEENLSVKYRKNTLENLIGHPEMVMFQSYRQHEHKNFRWYFNPAPLGGNKKARPAKPILIKKESIHWILMNYHLWLPAMKERTS